MKLPEFSLANAKWDRFKAFHIAFGPGYDGAFVQFDTGEFIITHNHFKPDDRTMYKDLGFAIYGTSDVWHRGGVPKFKLPDSDEIIPSAWLNRERAQTLLVDYDTGRAVRLSYRYGQKWQAGMPVRLRPYARAYFAGEGEPPIAAPVQVGKPKDFTKDEKDHIRGIVAACKGWRTLTEKKVDKYYSGFEAADLLQKNFKDMPENERQWVATNELRPSYDTTEVPYLLTQPA